MVASNSMLRLYWGLQGRGSEVIALITYYWTAGNSLWPKCDVIWRHMLLGTISSDSALLPERHQAAIWTNADTPEHPKGNSNVKLGLWNITEDFVFNWQISCHGASELSRVEDRASSCTIDGTEPGRDGLRLVLPAWCKCWSAMVHMNLGNMPGLDQNRSDAGSIGPILVQSWYIHRESVVQYA